MLGLSTTSSPITFLDLPKLCGLVDVHEQNSLVLQHVEVNVDLESTSYQAIAATLTYVNKRNESIDAVFIMPLHLTAIVYEIQGKIGYNGHCIDSPIATDTKDMTNVHRLGLGKVSPGTVVIVTLGYVEPVEQNNENDDEIVVKLPEFLQPRYVDDNNHDLILQQCFHLDFISTTNAYYAMDAVFNIDLDPLVIAEINTTDANDVTSIDYEGASKALVVLSTTEFEADHELEVIIQPAIEQSTQNVGNLIRFWQLTSDLVVAIGQIEELCQMIQDAVANLNQQSSANNT